MNIVRTLPIRATVRAGESLDSWLDATAAMYLSNRAALVSMLRLPPRLNLPEDATGGRLSDGDIQRMAGLFVIDEDDLHELVAPARLLERLAVRSTVGFRRPKLKPRRHSAFCSVCLAEGRGWLADWRKPWVSVCVDHGTTLLHSCPTCDGLVRSHRVAIRHAPIDESKCGHFSRVGRRFVRCDLSLKDLAPVPGEEQTLDLTRQIAGRDRDLVEPEVENDLVSLLEVGRLANREMDDGLLLRIVAAALGCDSALQHVLNRAPTPRNYGQPSAVVGASTALRLRVANGLTGNLPRVAYLRAFPAAIERGGLQAAKTAERVPAGYWPSLINAAISSLGTGSLKTGAALAVATVLVGNRSLEAEARRHLGLYQSWGATSVIGHGSAPGEIAVLARVGDAAVAAHEGRVPIDYARRRILASEILSERDWMVVARMSGFRPIADDLPRARLLASTIFGGANLDLRADKDTWRFVRILPHTVFFRLVEHLEGTLREAEIDEPLLWDPEPDPLVDLAREGRSILSQTTKTMRQVATELGTSPGALTAALAMNARTLAEELGATRGAIRHDVSTADIVAGFQGGQTVREVADRVGATKDRVRGILHTLGVPTPIGRKTLEIDRDWLITKYATSSFNEIARELGVSPPVVTRQARQYGIVPRIGTPSHVAVLRPEADSLELPEPLRAALACPNGKVRTARFVSLAFFVSFVEAAQELGAGPAVLSTQIKALEGCVGERLVARPSKKLRNAMRFTQTGELLCKQGAQFFGVVLPEPLLEPVAQVADSLQGLRVLRLAVLCDAAGSIAQAARMIGRHEWSVANSITRWEARFGLNLLRWDFVAGSCELTEVGLLAWAQWQCRATIKATSPRLFEVATTPDRLTLQ